MVEVVPDVAHPTAAPRHTVLPVSTVLCGGGRETATPSCSRIDRSSRSPPLLFVTYILNKTRDAFKRRYTFTVVTGGGAAAGAQHDTLTIFIYDRRTYGAQVHTFTWSACSDSRREYTFAYVANAK